MNVAIVNCFDTYEHRVDLLYDFFSKQGNKVRVYTSDFRHIEKSVRKDIKKNFLYIHARPYYKNISPSRMLSHAKFAKDVFERLEHQKVDLLWVLVPPNSLVRQAALFKKSHPTVKLIFDIIDMWPETMPIEKIKSLPVIPMWANLRDKWINCADHVVTECDLFQTKLIEFVPKSKMTTVYLAREIKPYIGNPNPPDDRISLCYLGSINNIIDIPTIGRIIQQIKHQKPVDLHIIGDGEKRDELISTAKQAGANVVYHGKIYDPEEKQAIMDRCHFGLNIMKDTVFVGLTMKSMDYFEAGLPIINNIKGDIWDIVENKRIGLNYGTDYMGGIDFSIINNGQVRRYFENNFSAIVIDKAIETVVKSLYSA
ncbi:glycosyltransferase [Ruminococcus albus]|uniref:Uncharacterized protein n=1 Tax=Ruminococcus albus (strain ATCC 27210 / DSM 20455 / JCM 14654 / NCDO 2250 / 7) TaxID=697329 RepID=E6UKU0_RUMA7|nr:glycosyltransferase [Ruminococcus albus]ADU24286.1 hypothetical protein Rumal_3862 [Ruminococcus albus 7 = DSM 20455]